MSDSLVLGHQDILCQVRSDDSAEALIMQSVEVDGDIAYMTFAVPLVLLDDFKVFFESVASIAKYAKWQLKIKCAEQKVRDAAYVAEQKKQYELFSDYVVSTFDSFTATGSSPRQAIRETRDCINRTGQREVTCSTVEIIVRQAGCLSKRKGRSPLWEKKAKC